MSEDQLEQVDVASLRFTLFSPNEIEKITHSLQILNPNTFDSAMNCNSFGMHDPRLGPQNFGEICETCGEDFSGCEGHYGFLKLPVPVFNPIFYSQLIALLRSICLNCCRINIPKKIIAKLLYKSSKNNSNSNSLNSSKLKNDQSSTNSTTDLENSTNIDNASDSLINDPDTDCIDDSNIFESYIKQRQNKRCINCSHPAVNISSRPGSIIVVKVRSTSSLAISKTKNNSNIPNFKTPQHTYILNPLKAKNILQTVWQKESHFLSKLFPVFQNFTDNNFSCATDIFFIDRLFVTPSKFRPLSQKAANVVQESPHTFSLNRILTDTTMVKDLIKSQDVSQVSPNPKRNSIIAKNSLNMNDSISDSQNAQNNDISSAKLIQNWSQEKLNQLNQIWGRLQNHVNGVFDSEKDVMTSVGKVSGVKQILEKKEGLLRMHMMGKRVNFAMRSVISPDPMLNVNEVGIPENFAMRITFLEPINANNLEYVCKLILNGPDQHPGALMLQTSAGIKRFIKKDLRARQSLVRQLKNNLSDYVIIHRHLDNGDVLYMNRQPSLHRNSMQGHIVQILPNQKTLRIHYSSCKSYNADFDGDEMNGHLCQSYLSKAEALLLANVDNNYIVPKDGTPIAGLIQDHVISGVHISSPDSFFESSEYFQLISHSFRNLKSNIKLVKPAIFANGKAYWTGKQIFTTIIVNIVSQYSSSFPTLHYRTKIPLKEIAKNQQSKLYDSNMCNSNVIICNGDLMCGYIDKASLGSSKFGIIHKCNELYGGSCSTKLLSSFSHLLTYSLRRHGFTLGLEDVLLLDKSDNMRHSLVCKFDKSFIKNTADSSHQDNFSENLKTIANNTEDSGLLKKFPSNNLQLMIISGSKGTMLNSVQISQNVGQIQLEGKKIERSILGMTLPSFNRNDPNPRSTGFVVDRFSSGLRPQDFFMHCMAGREGLVDTNVKTSRIGYLQRCLVKSLEGLIIHYDGTVRDLNNSNCITQFVYGEDGIDSCKTSYLLEKDEDISSKGVKMLKKHNINSISRKKIKKYQKQQLKANNVSNAEKTRAYEPFDNFCMQYTHPKLSKEDVKNNTTIARTRKDAALCYEWSQLSESDKSKYAVSQSSYTGTDDTLLALYNCHAMLGSVSDKYLEFIDKIADEKREKLGKKEMKSLLFKYMKSLGEPGDNVGVVCAQSIGEPSTQMTLNTFHLAGHGDVNVTLGVPRLKEIIMTAAKSISTPLIEIDFRKDLDYIDLKSADSDLSKLFNPQRLIDRIESVEIVENDQVTTRHKTRLYSIKFTLNKEYISKNDVENNTILRKIETQFIPKLCSTFARKLKLYSNKINSMKGTISMMNLLMRSEQISTINDNKQEKDDNANDDSDSDLDDEYNKEGQANENSNTKPDEFDESDVILTDDVDTSNSSNSCEKQLDEANEPEIEAEGNVDACDDLLGSPPSKLKKSRNVTKDHSSMSREQLVVSQSGLLHFYEYDKENESYCSFGIRTPLDVSSSKFNFESFFKNFIDVFKISNNFSGCEKCVIKDNGLGNKSVAILGISNIDSLLTSSLCHKVLDFNSSRMNSIADMIECFGIEVGYTSIINEIRKVFSSYGISVDYRHLSLLADHMTHSGAMRGLNRAGTISESKSPFHKMSFETCFEFLKQSVVHGKTEDLQGPSARICMGQAIKSGTGMFDIFTEF